MSGAPDDKSNRGGAMKGTDTQQRMPADKGAQRAQDDKAKGAATRPDSSGKAASEMNGQRSKEGMSKEGMSKDGMKTDRNAAETKGGADKAGTTTGQAGAVAKLTTEQRTTVRAAITKQNVRPVTNVNFSISVGTRVPRTVTFYPVPVELVTFYPSWRGYEYFLVGDQIVVVNPRTMEIVAVLEA